MDSGFQSDFCRVDPAGPRSSLRQKQRPPG